MSSLLNDLQDSSKRREVAEYIDQILEAFQEGTRLEIVKTFTPNKSVYPSQNARLSEPLTLRELQVLKLLATEMSTKEIAGQLAISYNTLRVHIKKIYRKLEVHKRVEAVQIAREKDLI